MLESMQSMHRRAFQHTSAAQGTARMREAAPRHARAARTARARCGRDAGVAQAVRRITRANAGQQLASAGVAEVALEEEKMGRRRKTHAEGKEAEEHSRNPGIHA